MLLSRVFLRVGLTSFLLLLCVAWSAFAQEPDYSLLEFASAERGKLASYDERCQECHGANGNIHAKNDSTKIPKLAGQSPTYLLKQFNDFRSGARHHDFMAMMARTVDDEIAVDIFAHYAAQPVMQGAKKDSNPLGKKLYLEGDSTRQIQACVSCHGADGRGLAANDPSVTDALARELIPIIGGQDWHYLDQQMRAWRSGERSNSSDGLMNKITAKLRDDELTALTDYISNL